MLFSLKPVRDIQLIKMGLTQTFEGGGKGQSSAPFSDDGMAKGSPGQTAF